MVAAPAKSRIALVNMDGKTYTALRECLRGFHAERTLIFTRSGERLQREAYEACVVRHDDPVVHTVLEAARSSQVNRDASIYVICDTPEDLEKLSGFGVSAALFRPLEVMSAREVVAQARLTPDFRTTTRFPIAADVNVEMNDNKMNGQAEDISVDGMAIRIEQTPGSLGPMLVSWIPPEHDLITVTALPCWVKQEEKRMGVCFGPLDEGRMQVKHWIERYYHTA